jgi:hypothetical protein
VIADFTGGDGSTAHGTETWSLGIFSCHAPAPTVAPMSVHI